MYQDMLIVVISGKIVGHLYFLIYGIFLYFPNLTIILCNFKN